ncbi:MAG: serine hydrolase, partial [Bacteroidota bacterium]
MKKFLKYLVILLLILIIGGLIYVYPRLPILNGYNAKMACSCAYFGNENPEQILAEDLNYFPVNLASVNFNKNEKSASASFFGLGKETAVYRPGLGCVVLNNPKESEARFSKPLYKNSRDSIQTYNINQVPQLTSGTNAAKLNIAFDKAFDETGEFEKKTRALLVVHRDTIIKEAYAPGFDKDSPLLGWSMTKSISNTLMGILSKNNMVDISQASGIAAWQNDERKKITINDLLQMQSGLDWEENYFQMSDVTEMLYDASSAYKRAIEAPYGYEPGTHWYYSSGTSNIISGVIRNIINDDAAYLKFPYDSLFYPLGIDNVQMETDGDGNYIMSSYCFMPARAWAALGLLYLHDGIWNGK